MRRRILAGVLATILCVSTISVGSINVYAKNTETTKAQTELGTAVTNDADSVAFDEAIQNAQSDSVYQEAAIAPNVTKHTKKEIINFVNSHGGASNTALSYAVNPVTSGNFLPGTLSNTTLNGAINKLNQIRYIAGLDFNVTLDATYNEKCQTGSLVNYVNNQLSHFPTQPAGMSTELYNLGYSGTSSSNIAWGSWRNMTLDESITKMWMEDGDSGNISVIGHRRWVLNPKMGKTGFGAVTGSNGTYTSMYSFDSSNYSAKQTGVVWPAQVMPVEYFGTIFPWSYSSGKTENRNNVKVTLTRMGDGKVWTFSASDSSSGFFNVDNAGYGQAGCVIFRPNSTSYKSGDVFKVQISGLVSGTVEYTVEFFSLSDSVVDVELIKQFVTRLYNVCLNREPDASGLASWTNELANGNVTGIATAYGFIFSDEFKNRNYCNEHYLLQLYKAFLGREADSTGYDYWLEQLNAGVQREKVFNGFCMSQEFKGICDAYGITLGSETKLPQQGTVPTGSCSLDGVRNFVKRLYLVCLGREYDVVGLNYWEGRLNSRIETGASAARGFVFSQEMTDRHYSNQEFIECLYKTFMDRNSDEGGLTYWINQMNGGKTREDVFSGFAESAEFTSICAGYGINPK